MKIRGFTLIELLISVTISLIVIFVIVNFLILGSQSYQKITRGIDLQRNARLVSERLIREVKRAKYIDPISDGGSLIFKYVEYNLNSNPINYTESIIRYYVDTSGILRRQVKQGSLWVGNNPLTENNIKVLTPVFFYLDSSGNPVSSPNLANIILVSLRLDSNLDGQSDYTLTFSIYLPVKETYFLR
jgi:prepilin-type N-terminal cleavage/methylation domain-containing protein